VTSPPVTGADWPGRARGPALRSQADAVHAPPYGDPTRPALGLHGRRAARLTRPRGPSGVARPALPL